MLRKAKLDDDIDDDVYQDSNEDDASSKFRLSTVLWNSVENRFRAGCRLAISILLAGIPAIFVLIFILEGGDVVTIEMLALGITLITLDVFAVGLFCCKYVDKRPLKTFGLDLWDWKWWQDAIVGYVAGVIGQFVIFCLFYAIGTVTVEQFWYNHSDVSFGVGLVLSVWTYLLVSAFEEAAFRAYFIENLFEGLNDSKIASISVTKTQAYSISIVIAAVLWGCYHAVLDHASLVSTLVISCFGILFGISFVWSKHLGSVFGFHTAWNLTQSNFFGFANSGMDVGLSILRLKISGCPEWLTGGNFGPEAGVAGTCGIVVGFLVIFAYLRLQYGPLAKAVH